MLLNGYPIEKSPISDESWYIGGGGMIPSFYPPAVGVLAG